MRKFTQNWQTNWGKRMNKYVPMMAIIVVFGGLGSALLLTSHAATPVANIQAEVGTTSSAASNVTDSTASNGQAVKFGQAQSGSRCPAYPSFPDASCTGVPAGTTLTNYTGPTTITTPNTVIDSKNIGCIEVDVPGVIIRNSKISCNAGGDVVASYDGYYTGTPLTIQDSEIDCKDTNGTAIGDTNITVIRVNVHGCENGFDLDAYVTVQDSYIHDMFNSAAAHTDGIQFGGGHYVNGNIVAGALNITITHNTIYGMGADGSFGTSAIISNRGNDTNILIQNNLLAGGAFTLYCEQNATGVNYRVISNHFSRLFGPNVGAYGPSTDCSDETLSGNVYHETGQLITLD